MSTGRETRTVELIQAFLWTCEECGRDNFERAVTIAPESLDPENLPEFSGMDPDEVRQWIDDGGEGVWMTAPSEVQCPHCGSRFSTVDE